MYRQAYHTIAGAIFGTILGLNIEADIHPRAHVACHLAMPPGVKTEFEPVAPPVSQADMVGFVPHLVGTDTFQYQTLPEEIQ